MKRFQVKCISCFKALSVKSRFVIFRSLKQSSHPLTVTELVRLVGLQQPTVTFHLGFLEKVGLVEKIREGREVYCQLGRRCRDCPLFL